MQIPGCSVVGIKMEIAGNHSSGLQATELERQGCGIACIQSWDHWRRRTDQCDSAQRSLIKINRQVIGCDLADIADRRINIKQLTFTYDPWHSEGHIEIRIAYQHAASGASGQIDWSSRQTIQRAANIEIDSVVSLFVPTNCPLRLTCITGFQSVNAGSASSRWWCEHIHGCGLRAGDQIRKSERVIRRSRRVVVSRWKIDL